MPALSATRCKLVPRYPWRAKAAAAAAKISRRFSSTSTILGIVFDDLVDENSTCRIDWSQLPPARRATHLLHALIAYPASPPYAAIVADIIVSLLHRTMAI